MELANLELANMNYLLFVLDAVVATHSKFEPPCAPLYSYYRF